MNTCVQFTRTCSVQLFYILYNLTILQRMHFKRIAYTFQINAQWTDLSLLMFNLKFLLVKIRNNNVLSIFKADFTKKKKEHQQWYKTKLKCNSI